MKDSKDGRGVKVTELSINLKLLNLISPKVERHSGPTKWERKRTSEPAPNVAEGENRQVKPGH